MTKPTLTDQDIAEIAAQLGVEPAVIHAVAQIEAPRGGFLPDGRPEILYEAHVFGRLTGHRYDASHPNASAPSWDRSLYGPGGEHQYDRLDVAQSLDYKAAHMAASWGKFQILGENHKMVGFATVDAFVNAMFESERKHLDAFVAYCRSANLIDDLQRKDWAGFTRGYNGPGQVDAYAGKLEAAYKAASKRLQAPSYDRYLVAKALQTVLASAGLYRGIIEGNWGPASRAAYDKFNKGV